MKRVSDEVITALNTLMTCEEISKNGKELLRVNHFKRWLIDFTAKAEKSNTDNVSLNS